VTIYASFDPSADIAWFRLDEYLGTTAVSEMTDFGLRDVDPVRGMTVGLEFWRASDVLPRDLLDALPAPGR
jgi:uncharacterized protein YuzE